jgi:hypothetical protein
MDRKAIFGGVRGIFPKKLNPPLRKHNDAPRKQTHSQTAMKKYI